MFHSVDLFGVTLLFLTVSCQGGQILQPQNVSLEWLSDFEPQLSWAHPPDSRKNCNFKVEWSPSDGLSEMVYAPPWRWTFPVKMNGGHLQVSVKTVCGSHSSAPVYRNFTYPDMVKNLECNIHSSEYTRCSWIPVKPHSPSFFYRINGPLQACPLYTVADNGRTSCDLRARITNAEIRNEIQILLNETQDKKTNRNIFWKNLQVKPPALNWTVTKTRDKFIINWTPPDIGEWKFIINYTECIENKHKDVRKGITTAEIPIVPHCQYNMKIKAQLNWDSSVETPWSTPYYFGSNPNVLLAATIITPLLTVFLVALLFVCWRKNKNSILPNVPKPRDLLSDISDNNNKSNVPNLYIPAQEEENCKITLVVDH